MPKKSLDKLSDKEFLFELTKAQVQPALGCTEIGIVSLACAKAASILPGKWTSASVYVSLYVYRNDARVGVPRLGRCGIKSIAAAGLILANPEKKLACLDALTPATIKQALKYGEPSNRAIDVSVDPDSDPVYTKVVAYDDKENVAEVTIMYSHDNIVSAKLNNKETLKIAVAKSLDDKVEKAQKELSWDDLNDKVSVKTAFEIISKTKLCEIEFLMDGLKMNDKVVEDGLKNPDPTSITKTWLKMMKDNKSSFGITSDKWAYKDIMLATAAAVDSRMYGCPLPVMTSSRSGDHGLTVTIPQQVYAKKFNIDKTRMLQAVMFAHYVTWKIKSKVGHLCGMCGSALAAGCGTIAGLAYQNGWDWEKINALLNFHMTSQGGVVCDGAKPSCSLKILASLMVGFTAINFVSEGGRMTDKNGLTHHDVDKTINNMARLSRRTQNATVRNMCGILDRMEKEAK